MKKKHLLALIFIFNMPLMAEEVISEISTVKKLTREKSALTTAPNESSSFIGDPHNIDPLKANQDNIKEDNEPILEDIRQVSEANTKANTKKSSTSENTLKKNKKSDLNPDAPDLNLEKKFHNVYKSYNINPTADDIWAAATSKQTLREYIVQKGDTLWSISRILFGDSSFWPKIWALNKQGILNPHFISPKSKIYFYMGDEMNGPSLAVNSLAQPGAGGESADSENIGISSGVIPDSLPLYRNEAYFGKKLKSDIKIDFGTPPRFDFENTSEIYITDHPIKPDVKIEIGETTKFRCYEGRILRDIKFVGKLVEDYEVYEPLNSFKTTVGTMYAYRAYGRARPYQIRKLKLYDCDGILATDLVIIPKEKIQLLKNRKVSITNKATIIGGPDVVEQRLFVPNQIAYVDFGANEFVVGEKYKTMSQVTDEINGHFKVIQKYGSFAVVLLTDVNDVIEIGDKVIISAPHE